MIQGTGSNVGKSTLVAGLARALVRRGLKVAPFKPQNMSNNAAVTVDGGEIGRAQAVQARAARLAPSVHMNPVLLKPETDTGAQVIVQGRRVGTLRAREFAGARKTDLMPAVLDSFARLARDADIVLVEGAGSPAEINLRAGDIANMGFAAAADVPVVLVGDIDRGGVIASLVGTHAVLEPAERARIRGFLINKFRGDLRLFDDGVTAIERLTGWPSLGVVPWLPQAAWLPAEDAVDLERAGEAKSARAQGRRCRCCRASRISTISIRSAWSRACALAFVPPGRADPGRRRRRDPAGLEIDHRRSRVPARSRAGTSTSRRMCGAAATCSACAAATRCSAAPSPIRDGIEGPAGSVEGLGLLDVETEMTADKSTVPVQGRHCATGAAVSGYEIHLGRTEGPGLRAADADDRRAAGRRRVARRARARHLCARAVRVGCVPPRLARAVRGRVAARLRGADRAGARRARRPSRGASRRRPHRRDRAQPSERERQRRVERRVQHARRDEHAQRARDVVRHCGAALRR